MADAESLKKSRGLCKGKLTRLVNRISKNQDQLSKTLLESRITELKTVWYEVQEKHDEYILVSNDGEETEEDTQWIEACQDTFEEWEAKLDTLLTDKNAENDPASEEKELTDARTVLHAKIENGEGKFNQTVSDIKELLDRTTEMHHNAPAASSALASLEITKIEMEKNQNELMTVLVQAREAVPISIKQSVLDAEKLFNEISTNVKVFCSKHNTIHENNKTDNTTSNTGGIRINKLQFEKFTGNIRAYPTFKNEFLKHVKPKYPASEEAFVLKSYLEKEIKEEVLTAGDDVTEIWRRLDKKYGDEGKLVDDILKDVKQLQKCGDDNPRRIIDMIVTIERAHRDLKYMSRESEISNSTIVSLIEQKLPKSIEDDWLKIVTGEDRITIGKDKFPRLLKLLLSFKERLEYKFSDLRLEEEEIEDDVHHADSRPARNNCWIHAELQHRIWNCRTFANKTIQEKLELVRLKNACTKCLDTGHQLNTCPRNFICRANNCNEPHHTLLHEAHTLGLAFHTSHTVNRGGGGTLLLLQKIMCASPQGNNKTRLNCLWDNGSTLSFITFEAARRLKLKGSRIQLKVTKVGGTEESVISQRYLLPIINNNNETHYIDVYGLERISSDIQSVSLNQTVKLFPGTSITDLMRPISGQVDFLLGMDVAGFHPIRAKAVGHLILYSSQFGPLLGGTHPSIHEKTHKIVQHAEIHLTHTTFEDIENMGVECHPRCGGCRCGNCNPGKKEMTLLEEEELRRIKENLQFDQSLSRWQVEIPCKKDLSGLQNNRLQVYNCLLSLEKRLKQNHEEAKLYQSQIEDMLRRKACRPLSQEEYEQYQGPKYFITHHGVKKPESKSTPYRIVFNSSLKFNQTHLNDFYVKGPSGLNNILGLQLRFCEEAVAMMCDISKMYHSIDISLRDQMTHIFLWRDINELVPPQMYVMTALNFGDRPSGSIASAALQMTAEMSEGEFPEACEMIKKNSYMDDILNSVTTRDKCEELKTAVTSILDNCGFHVKEWIISGESNTPIDPTLPDTLHNEHVSDERVLGMIYDPIIDKFRFQVNLNFSKGKEKIPINKKPSLPAVLTPRLILSQTSKIYDPRGFLGPFTARAKIMRRELQMHNPKLNWDDPIPQHLYQAWSQFFNEMLEVENLSFPRCLKPKNAVGNPDLILLSDGSEVAYAAVAYARWNIGDGKFKAAIIASKNKIAPIKIVNIVRLELCGSVLSKRLRVFIQSEMRYTFDKVIHIVDSEIVKGMIDSDSHGFNTYPANRIGEIHASTRKEEWYWGPGELNTADYATRGMSPSELDEGSLWQTGPLYLQSPMESWPTEQQVSIMDLPEKKTITHSCVHKPVTETLADRFDLNRFSKLSVLLNTTASILKLYKRFKQNSTEDVAIKAEDIAEAELFWIKEAQKELHEPVATGQLTRLTPQYKDGLIVVGSRAKRNIAATWNQQEFILLPYRHRFTLLMARYMHMKTGHLAESATTAMIRSRFWVIQLPRLAKKIVFSCVLCKVKREMLCGQIMAELPIERLRPSPAFFCVGIDFFGPYVIKGEVNKRTRGKCYGVIFACFSTRAVHVDMAVNYSTDAFLQTLRRFACLRGWPKEFNSDNGSQLVAASKELQEMIAALDQEKIRRECLTEGSNWNFTTADAPWMNGATEALVKSVKKAIHTTIGEQVLSAIEFLTAMYEVAQLVNQRPIGRHPKHPDDGPYLCPNDFVIGRSSPRVPQGPFKQRCSHKYRLDFLENVVGQFWNRWIRDVFPNMIIQPKWHVERRNVKAGDVVMIQDSDAFRGHYRMGIVKEALPSSDGKVRSVRVGYKNNNSDLDYTGSKFTYVDRPVRKLIVIVPVDESTSTEEELPPVVGGSVSLIYLSPEYFP